MPIKGSNILKSKKLQAELFEKGYAIFPLLSKEQVKELKDFYYQNNPEKAEGLVATAHDPNFEFRQKMSDKIHQVVAEDVTQHFENIEMLGGTFMNKTQGEKGVLPPHQDWNIVDEKKFASYNLWIPLVDVNAENGSIQVIGGSHIWREGYRGPNLHGPFAEQTNDLWEQMKTLNLKAGEVLAYDHRLLHCSNENKTPTDRLVIVFGVIPQQAEMFFYYEENGKVESYKSHKDFFLKQNPWEGPKGLEKVKLNKDTWVNKIKMLFNA